MIMRHATEQDAEAIHALVSAHVQEGRLLPRELDELRRHASRFVVCEEDGALEACAELAPLSASVAEVRSLVVAGPFRRAGLAARLVAELADHGKTAGFATLCAFTHDPRFFVRQGFSIVPRLWLPEKVTTDCRTCPFLLGCEQHAMMLPLEPVARFGSVAPAVRKVAVA
jgi:amino-acid N-acetyltransferase